MNSKDFLLNEDAATKAGLGSPLMFNTGKMMSNPEYNECPPGITSPELKYNDFVVYDSAQVRLRYAVLCQFH